MTEPKVKKNPDYTNSAVNLCNPEIVKALLENYRAIQDSIDDLDATLKAYPEYEQMVEKQQELAGQRKAIELNIELHGSYQDIDNGMYGLKQKAVTIRYEVGDFEHNYPQFIDAVIVKAINVEALKGLVKGGLISENGLRDSKVIQEKDSYKFIIK